MFIPDGSVSVTAKINRKGYCEGENICIDAKFENSCSRIIVPKAAIIITHTYRANGRIKVLREKISAVRGNHIISGMCDIWQGKTFRVPKLKPTILGCNLIHVDYTLMVSSAHTTKRDIISSLVWVNYFRCTCTGLNLFVLLIN